MYYARTVDMTVLMAHSSNAVEQTKATKKTMGRCTQLLDYLSGHLNATVRFHASDMILNIHSDASYLSEEKACSRECGHYYMGWMPKDGEPIRLNGAFHVSMRILRFVVASAAKAELGALYHNCKNRHYFLTHPCGYGSPATKNPSPLQQCHGSGHCKQYNQMPAFAINGNEIFLDWGQSCTRNVQT